MFLNLRKFAAKDTEFASELMTRELEILNALQRTTGTANDTITTRSTHPHPRQEFELRNRPHSRASLDVERSGIELAAISKRGGRWVSPPLTPTLESS